ncbi:hypothetical protein [Runella sp.]|uniref:hypothetical protein n=1 Tax=Runella sp. TaxID=1960881 RepID=UPI003D0E84A6
MLEQLMGLIQDHSQDAIVNNPAIPNQHNNDAMQTILSSVTGGLQNQAQQGNLSGLMGLLSGSNGTGSSLMNNPIVAGIAQNAIGSLMQKFGLSNNAAANVIAQVLPGVLTSMISKTSNPNDNSMDFGSIMGSLLGGQQTQQAQQQGGFDFNQIGYAMADGKLDMNDVMRIGGSLMGGGGSNNSGGGGLGGLLGGLFGK